MESEQLVCEIFNKFLFEQENLMLNPLNPLSMKCINLVRKVSNIYLSPHKIKCPPTLIFPMNFLKIVLTAS